MSDGTDCRMGLLEGDVDERENAERRRRGGEEELRG